jgi:hypothetical protein
MRPLLVLALVLGVATAAARVEAATPEKPDAQMLLDLDLLREADPRVPWISPVVGNLRLLEFLRRLQAPAAATPAPERVPAPRSAC